MKPAAWHEPNSYGKVTTHKKWALENGWLPLYAAPVRIKDLTDDEIDEIFEVNRTVGRLFQRDFARAVIAAFKEKNK